MFQILGMADRILDECAKNKYFNLELSYPDFCIPLKINNNKSDMEIDRFDIYY